MLPLSASMPREKPWERWLLALALAAFSALAWLEVRQWRPGYARTDETEALGYLQLWREGLPLPIELFKGTLHHHAEALVLWAAGPSILALHGLVWAAMAAELWLLLGWGRALLGRRAALWALLACLACGFSLLRSRSLLSFAVMPFELLAMMSLMNRVRGRLGSLLYGAAAALLLADYEGWMLALPVLLLLWSRLDPCGRPRLLWSLLGFSAVFLALLLPQWEIFEVHLVNRRRNLPLYGRGLGQTLAHAFKGFWIGLPETTGQLGIKNHPMMPAWTLPFLALGAWQLRHRGRFLLAWAAIGLLPLFSNGGGGEPNRLIAAFPALFLIAGQGLAFFFESLGAAALPAACLLLGGGAFLESRAFAASMSQVSPLEFAQSGALRRLALAHPHARAVMEFNYKSGAADRLLWEGAAGPPAEAEVFVMKNELLPALKGLRLGLHQEWVSEALPDILWFEEAPEGFKARLRACDLSLRSLRAGLPRYAYRSRLKGLLKALESKPDPIVFSALLEESLKLSTELGEVRPELVYLAMKGPLLSASAPVWLSDLAWASGDGASGRRLCERAKSIDPRCGCRL